MKQLNQKSAQKNVVLGLHQFDKIERAKELAFYQANPEVRMPILLKVQEQRVSWPQKFSR